MSLKECKFTVRVIGENPHERGSDAWRAGQIIEAMEGCSISSIIEALTVFEDNRISGIGDPARWLSTFAGFDKKIEPWLEILLDQQVITSEPVYRKQLAINPPRYLSAGEISHI
jgi:hypothetical protein